MLDMPAMPNANRDPKALSEFAVEFLETQGACAVGIATPETLAGGPPSVDLEYVLAGARAAVSFAVPLDPDAIERYLAKRDHASHQRDNFHTNFFVTGLAVGLADYWKQHGIDSCGVAANAVYRSESPRGLYDFLPDISHRYLAAASGVGWLGFSGNVITEHYGAAVVLGTVVTTAELIPTEPLPEEEKYCEECKLCLASCSSGLMDRKEKVSVQLGEHEFSYSKRRSYHRCDLVCGGFTGLAKNGKWSTWSPGRFEVPENDDEFLPVLVQTMQASEPRPPIPGGFHHPAMPGGRKINMTCGNCQLICHPDTDTRKRRYRMLTKSGVVVQNEDGSLEAISPDAAKKRLKEMPESRRALYESR